MAQWLRICLPMQGTRVRALVWEDPTCRGATRPVSHNYWACASGACAPQREAAIVRGPRTAMKSGPHLLQLEKALAQKRRSNTAKINKLIIFLKNYWVPTIYYIEILFHGTEGTSRTEMDKNLYPHRAYILFKKIHNLKNAYGSPRW